MNRPRRKRLPTWTRYSNRILAASPGRVTQTRGDPRRERRPEDLSGRLITAAHASVDSWRETRTRIDNVLGHATSRIRERLVGMTEVTILRVWLETAGEAKILCKLMLGEMNTNIPVIGIMMAEHHTY